MAGYLPKERAFRAFQRSVSPRLPDILPMSFEGFLLGDVGPVAPCSSQGFQDNP